LARLQLSKASLAHGLRCLLQRRLRLAAQPFLEVLEVTGGAFLELRFTAYPLRPRRLPQLLFARIALELLFGAHLGFTGGQRFGRTFAPRLGPLAFTLDEFGQRLLARLERANRLVPPLLEALALVPRSLAQGSLPLRQLRRRLLEQCLLAICQRAAPFVSQRFFAALQIHGGLRAEAIFELFAIRSSIGAQALLELLEPGVRLFGQAPFELFARRGRLIFQGGRAFVERRHR